MPSHPTPSRAVAAALTAAACVVALPAAAQAKAKPKPDVTVMSRNLYLGADIITLATATTVAAEQANAKALHATVDATNFPLRAKAIAKEIATTKPDIIGLQEVARYYRGPSGVHDGVKNAKTPLYDWLALLQTQLKAKHMGYKVVSREDEIDVEVPSDDGYDLRLKLGNAVLVRTGKGTTVKSTGALSGVFKHQITVPLADQKIVLKRGWAGMKGKVAGRSFVFLDPHAEAYSGTVATQQFKELLSRAAKSKKTPTIIAGDFNSDPAATGADAGGYKAVIAAGFKDTSKRKKTCCQDEGLTNTPSKLNQWIDHIVVRPFGKVLKTKVVGDKLSDRIGGLWPSDHAGIVAKIRLK